MKKLLTLPFAGCVLLLSFGFGTLKAQDNTLQAKEELRQSVGINYDIWRLSQTPPVEKPNVLVSEHVENQRRSYLIRLGKDLADKNAEQAYESKLLSQPGILSADADHVANTVKVVIKEEDEHKALESYFDIQ